MAKKRLIRKAVEPSQTIAKPNRRTRKLTLKKLKAVGHTDAFNDMVAKGSSSQAINDPFKSMYSKVGGKVGIRATAIKPMFNPKKLVNVSMTSSALQQCIDAYMVNIESYGHTIEYIGPEGEQDSEDAVRQKRLIDSFLSAPTDDKTLREVRELSRQDKEKTGNRYFEIGRYEDGTVAMINHLPSTTMRMTLKDKEATEADVYYIDSETGEWETRVGMRYFRRFIQIGEDGETVFFKEFGDPRPIDPKTGQVNEELEWEETATEVYLDAIYMPGHEYGVPRWIGALPALLGSRESEMVNLNFFKENAIPAMAVLISGGMLTEESFEKIEEYITAAKGKAAMHRVLVLEASADDSAGTIDQHPPSPKIDMKPMISERQQEGLFGDYDDRNTAKVRSMMRLPPIYTGRSEEYTKATAAAAMRTAESQVFTPERTSFDDFMNFKIFPTMNITLWRYKSSGPTVYDPEAVARMVDSFNRSGAMTPNTVIKLANQMLDLRIESINEEWGDMPLQFTVDALKRGAEIPGLDDFITEVDNAGFSSNPDDSNEDIAELRDYVRDSLSKISEQFDDLRASQTFAKAA